jgi:lysophospholipase L1-like esterase
MDFTTKIPLLQYDFPISYNSKVLLLGSCFAENIGEKFEYFKFKNSINPFGILFHPLAIKKMVSKAVNEIAFTENDIFFYNEHWHCFDVHSQWSNTSKDELLIHLNQQLTDLTTLIKEATHIIITYGTSWVYRSIALDTIVANCHKLPQKQFHKLLLSTDSIKGSMQSTIAQIQKMNPDCKFIFTVSPVRHIKDGFVENQRSKAHLITAIHNTIDQYAAHNKHQPNNVSYFPSYEIMMDELRDYRFYTEDMLHPNKTAITYIWERFAATHIQEESTAIMQQVGTIQKARLHRPFDPDAENHQKFLLQLEKRTEELQKQLPHIKF